jgi:biotin carboxyl carrier protein
MDISFVYNRKEFKLNLKEAQSGHLSITINKKKYDVSVEFFTGEEMLLKIGSRVYDVIVNQNSNSYNVCMKGKSIRVDKTSLFQTVRNSIGNTKKIDVKTSMPGRVVERLLREGDRVKENDPVLVLEAMKMQNEIKSPRKGRIRSIYPKAGDSVEAGAVLFTIE